MAAYSRATRLVANWVTAVLAGATVSLGGPGAALAQKPPQEWDGLVRRDSSSLEHVYVLPNVKFKGYKRVRLYPVAVRMDKNWDPNSGRVALQGTISSADIQRIREDLAKAFRDVFAENLSKAGYPLVDTDGDDVLAVQAAMINVNISAPESSSASGATRAYVMDPGRITLVLELFDSVTGQTLARAVDTKQGPNSGTGLVQWSNSVTNSTGARWVIGQWADALRKALDEVNGGAAGK